MKYLVRKYIKNQDKDNEVVETWEEALKLLGKSEKDIYLTVPLFGGEDFFFIGTQNYIRKII